MKPFLYIEALVPCIWQSSEKSNVVTWNRKGLSVFYMPKMKLKWIISQSRSLYEIENIYLTVHYY